jgi:hypothetical protein
MLSILKKWEAATCEHTLHRLQALLKLLRTGKNYYKYTFQTYELQYTSVTN